MASRSERNRNPRKQTKKRKVKKITATTLDEAYLMYMKMHDQKPPTASRLKKFINDEKRVQIGHINFVSCDTYLRTTGRGRKSSTANFYNVSPSKAGASVHKRKKLNLHRSKSNSFHTNDTNKRSTNKQRTKPMINKHKRSVKSVDYKDEDKNRKRKHSNNKSRAEKPVTSIAALTHAHKLYKNKYGAQKGSVGRKQKAQTKNGHKKRTKNGHKKQRKNGVGIIPINSTDHVEIPNDETFAQLMGEIPSSPALNGIKNSSVDMESINSVLKSFPFIEHMSLTHCDRLRVNDKIDHRYSDGQFLAATILSKNGSKIKLNYDKYGPYQSKYDIWSDYKYEIYRFAKYHSITLRPAHRMDELRVGQFVDMNAHRHKKKSHRGWKTAEIIKRDYKSGQIKLEYAYKTRKCVYWTHLDNISEISLLGSMTEMKSEEFALDLNMNMDHTISNKALAFAQKFPELNLDTSIIRSNGGLTPENSGHMHLTPISDTRAMLDLDLQNVHKWGSEEVLHWFAMIENGRFGNDDEYDTLRKALKDYAVNGKDLLQFNDVFLRMVGVGDGQDRSAILSNIKRIAPVPPKVIKNGGHVRKLSQIEIDKGVQKATVEYTKQNQELKSKIETLESKNERIKSEHKMKMSEFEKLQKEFAVIKKQKSGKARVNKKGLTALKAENARMTQKLSALTQELTQTTKELNHKNDEMIGLRKKISALNKDIQSKDETISVIKTQSKQQISQLKNELKTMAEKVGKLNISDTKTKNSARESEMEMLNGSEIKYDTPQTPDSVQSESVSVLSVNSASPSLDIHSSNGYHNIYDNNVQRTVIIDNGSETIKIGYGSEQLSESHKPSKKFHSIIGTPKQSAQSQSPLSDDLLYIGDEAYNKQSILDIQAVINRGCVTNWEAMEKLWDYTFFNKLNIPSRYKGAMHNIDILLSESLNRSKAEREKSVQTMFEAYEVGSMFMVNEAVLSLYGTGKVTGNVLGIGYGQTYCASVFEGMVLPQSIVRVNSAGFDVTQYLKQILCEKYANLLRGTKHSIFKDMKQKYCFVAENFHESLRGNGDKYKKYKLPDGNSVRIGNERFRACEPLFGGFINLNNEEMLTDTRKLFTQNSAFDKSGVQHMIHCSVELVNDSDLKREMYGNLVLSGGTTLFKGLSARLYSELRKLTKESVNIVANEKRKYLAWIGGSIVSSLSNFRENFITKSEYDESGPRIVHKKCP